MSRTDEINAPTLVIHGTEDPIIPYDYGVHLSEIIPNAVLVTLDGAGHELHHNDWDDIINGYIKACSKFIINYNWLISMRNLFRHQTGLFTQMS